MDTVLMSVTLISLAIASALAFVVTKLLREERRRSDARIAALTELAGEPAASVVPEPAPPLRIRPAAPRTNTDVHGTSAHGKKDSVSVRVRRIDDLEIRPAVVEVPTAVDAGSLFETPAQSSPWGRRLAVIGVMAFVAGGAVLALTYQRGTAGPAPAATHEERAASTSAPAPLELVSLRHAQQGDTLTITGLVQNPKAGAPHARLAVTAVVFDGDGGLLASGKAPLDYTKLGAGDESPFVITVPVTSSVARYRIGFRAEDGSVVAHVDRRDPDVRRAGL